MRGKLALRAFNVSLRGASVGAKFILLFSLARYLPPSEVGLYGLVAATIIYVQYALGFDFCKYANRELIAADREHWTSQLRDQGVLYLLTYAVVLPLSLLLFAYGVLPWSVVAWFMVLLVLEHLGHELCRTLIAMSEQVTATLVLFVRSAAWALILVPAMWLDPRARTLDWVFGAWALGATIACVIGLRPVIAVGAWDLRRRVNWPWLAKGVRIAAPLLVATIALKGLGTFDRYVMDAIGGRDALAAYVLFAGLANAVKAFLDHGVFHFIFARLVKAVSRGDERSFRAGMRSLTWQTVVVSLGTTAVLAVLIRPLLQWIHHPVYSAHLDLFYWTLAAMNLYALAMIAYYGIYAHHKDSVIIISNLLGLAVFFPAAWALHSLGAVAVPIAGCVAYGTILVLNWLMLRRIRFPAADGGRIAPA